MMGELSVLSKLVGRLEEEIASLGAGQDESRAQQWRLKRGELARAQYKLFELLKALRPLIAVQLLWRSAELGYHPARKQLYCTKSNPGSQSSPEELEKLDKNVLFLQGLQAVSGVGMVSNDHLAFQCFEFSAKQGHVPAQANLGLMYSSGRGVAQDDALAVHWCRQAAKQGHAIAQYNLGWMYLNGQGVAQNYGLAVHCYRQAAEQGYAIAQRNLGVRYHDGRGVAQDDGLAVHWYRQAAEQGYATAQNDLGLMYLNGRVEADPERLLEYRQDVSVRKVRAALRPLKELAWAGHFKAGYHLVMLQEKNGTRLLRQDPNAFFEALVEDEMLDEKTRFSWFKRLFDDYSRSRERFEGAEEYAHRPTLNAENFRRISIEVAFWEYARLSQEGKKYNTVWRAWKRIKVTVDLVQIQETRKKIDQLISIFSTILEDHPRYAEAQFILAHLHYMVDREGAEWRQHLKSCEQADVGKQWIDHLCFPEEGSINIIRHYREAVKNGDERKAESLRLAELKKVGENKYAIEPLLRLSIMAKRPEQFDSALQSLKALGLDEATVEEQIQKILITPCIIQDYRKALKKGNEAKAESLRLAELKKVGENKYAIEPLLRLSIMAKDREQSHSALQSLKALGLDEATVEGRIQTLMGVSY